MTTSATTSYIISVKQCRPDHDFVLSVLGDELVQAERRNGDATQQWSVVFNQYHDDSGRAFAGYALINVETGLAAKFNKDNETVKLANLILGNSDFVWRLDDVGEGFYAINRWDKHQVMDVKSRKCETGTPVITYGWNRGDNQRWELRVV